MPSAFARDDDVGGRAPEAGRAFDVKLLAGRRIVQRLRFVLRAGRRRQRRERRREGGAVQANSGSVSA